MNKSNKIAIPWYRRNVKLNSEEDIGSQPVSFNFPNLPKPKAKERQPQPEPEPDPVKSPVKVPATSPVPNPSIEPKLSPFDLLFPDSNPFGNKFPLPIPLPPLPTPKDKTGNNPIPQPVAIEKNPFDKMVGTILKPVLYYFLAKEITSRYIEANVTDPIYNKMLQDPVLGFALKEAEKSNLDMEAVANYFANYDYSNFNADEMTKELTAMFGAATAARIIIYFIGRKVVFKI